MCVLSALSISLYSPVVHVLGFGVAQRWGGAGGEAAVGVAERGRDEREAIEESVRREKTTDGAEARASRVRASRSGHAVTLTGSPPEGGRGRRRRPEAWQGRGWRRARTRQRRSSFLFGLRACDCVSVLRVATVRCGGSQRGA